MHFDIIHKKNNIKSFSLWEKQFHACWRYEAHINEVKNFFFTINLLVKPLVSRFHYKVQFY